jgi:hypothetical protein
MEKENLFGIAEEVFDSGSRLAAVQSHRNALILL